MTSVASVSHVRQAALQAFSRACYRQIAHQRELICILFRGVVKLVHVGCCSSPKLRFTIDQRLFKRSS